MKFMDTTCSRLGRGVCKCETIAFSGSAEGRKLINILVPEPATANAKNNHLFNI